MGKKPDIDLSMRIAPKQGYGYWTVADWDKAQKSNDWPTMFQLFKDRLDFRYFVAVKALIDADKQQPTRRFGFAIMALDCLLIETLAQFYQGLKTSNDARCEKGHKLSNTEFYVGFLLQGSLKLKTIFDIDWKARLFYKAIRCGILHQGEVTGRSKIVTAGRTILDIPEQGVLIINRNLFHEFLVDEEYASYCRNLGRNVPPYRQNMIKKMKYICQIPIEDGDQP